MNSDPCGPIFRFAKLVTNYGYDIHFRVTLAITGILLLIIGTAVIGPMPDGE